MFIGDKRGLSSLNALSGRIQIRTEVKERRAVPLGADDWTHSEISAAVIRLLLPRHPCQHVSSCPLL